MSVIRPFRGLRPRAEHAAQVASPPYDVLTSGEARELVRNNPDSFLRVNKPEVDFPPEADPYGEEVYERGKDNLRRLIEGGVMCRDDADSLYLYRLTMDRQDQTGLVALTSVAEYNQGLIKKHEHTRPEKVTDRANHIMHAGAQVGPVFCAFRHRDDIRELFSRIAEDQPVCDFTSDDRVRHRLWVIEDAETIDRLVQAFGQLPQLYIADGHHRSAAAAEVAGQKGAQNPDRTGDESYNYFLSVLFPDDELRILPYNRVVRDLNNQTLEQVLLRLQDTFAVVERMKPVLPDKRYHIGMYVDRGWYELVARPGTFEAEHPALSLDAAVLSANVLTPILGIEDIRTDQRIDFVGGRGVDKLVTLVDSDAYVVAFVLCPITVEQLLRVADAGEVMPPKTTWFEPKLRSGMVVNLFNDA